MKFILYLLIIAACIVSSCTNKTTESTAVVQDTTWNIKVCKMYQSDFVFIDPEEKGQLIQEFRFNKNGFVNELIRYDMEGKVIGKFDIYGENTPFPLPGQPEFIDTVLNVVTYDTSGTVKHKEVNEYNSKGLLTQVKFYEGEDILVKKNTYKYDDKNMILEDVYWDIELDKPKQKIRYEFEYFTE